MQRKDDVDRGKKLGFGHILLLSYIYHQVNWHRYLLLQMILGGGLRFDSFLMVKPNNYLGALI
jgi:hypothetical protein